MSDRICPVESLRDFLGVDEEADPLLESLRSSALARLNLVTGCDWTEKPKNAIVEEAVRTMVWIAFYGIRDASKNTEFLERYSNNLICDLQLSAEPSQEGGG